MTNITNKFLSVPLDIDEYDGDNAFMVLGAFGKAARRAGYSKEEIDAVRTEAMSGDYDHLIAVIRRNCED